jgi:hypothetical protein
MRNSLALLGIPDLPIYAFRHVGDRRIQPQGGVSSVVESVSDVVSTASNAVSGVVSSGGGGGGGGFFGDFFGGISDAISDVGSGVSDALATIDDTVNSAVPGGWATVASIAVPVAAPYIQATQAAVALDKGASLEDVAKNYAISQVAGQVGGEVGAETGSSFAGNVASGTTGGLLSGKSLQESLQGGVISGGVSQVTPSTLLSSGGTSGQGTTGATNMAQEDFTFGYGGEGYQYGGVGSTPSPQDFTYGYGDLGYEGTGSAPYTQAEINALIPQTYGGNNALSSLDAATQATIRRALAAGGSAAQGARNYLSSMGGGMNSNLLQGGAGTAAQLMQLQANREAAQQAQARIGQATQQGVAGSQFRPVGTTTRFGTSQFQVDPATGQLVSAGYTAAPEITSAQNRLMGLGASYLAQTPEEVAQQYMTRQYDLLDPSRQRQLAGIRNQNFQTGRGGLSVGSTGLRPSGAQGLMGANPELEAYYNAMAQQDAQLAAQAQQAGQQNVLFGTGLFGQAGQLETMAQQPFSLSQGLAEKSSLGGARAGSLGIQGNVYGNAIGLSAANTTNPFATVLGGLSSPTSLLAQGIGSYFSSPFGGTPQGGGAQLGQYMAGVTANPQTEQARMLAEQEAAFRY